MPDTNKNRRSTAPAQAPARPDPHAAASAACDRLLVDHGCNPAAPHALRRDFHHLRARRRSMSVQALAERLVLLVASHSPATLPADLVADAACLGALLADAAPSLDWREQLRRTCAPSHPTVRLRRGNLALLA